MKSIQELKNKVLEKTQLVFIITDPSMPDNPVIYANQGFTNLTGYSQEEIIGQNCRFLQGKGTNLETVEKIRNSINDKEAITVEILNYKKNTKPFWNLLHIDPIYLEEEQKYYFVGIQKDITVIKQAEQKIDQYNLEIELLSTPMVPIKQGVSILPLIGTIDQKRIEGLIDRILPQLTKEATETLILDLSGFTNLDQQATIGIFQLSDLLKLKGVNLIITGITPKLALKTKGLDIDFSSLVTYGSVKQGIEAIEKQQK